MKLKNDVLIVSDMVSMTLTCDIPYVRRIALNAKNGKNLDKDYQSKVSKVLLSASMFNFPKDRCVISSDYRSSMERSIQTLVSAINSMEVDDPIAYEKEHLMPLNVEDLRNHIRENAHLMRDAYEIKQTCSPGTALSSLRASFQNTFEKVYLPSQRYIKDALSADNIKVGAYYLSEKILCYEKVYEYDGKVKSDIREIRNLLEHDPTRDGSCYFITLPDGACKFFTEDDLFNLSMMTSLRSLFLSSFCNLFLVLRMYDLAYHEINGQAL